MRSKNKRTALNRFLESFGNPPADAAEAAVERVRKNLDLRGNDDVAGIDSTHAAAEARVPAPRWLWPAAALVPVVVIGILVVLVYVRNSAGTFQGNAGARRLAYEEMLRANDAGSSVLTLSDGSRVEMRSGTELQIDRAEDGVRIHLHGGGVIAFRFVNGSEVEHGLNQTRVIRSKALFQRAQRLSIQL